MRAAEPLGRIGQDAHASGSTSSAGVILGATALLVGAAASGSSTRRPGKRSAAVGARVSAKAAAEEGFGNIGARAQVDAWIAKFPVFMISKKFCPFCKKAKAALDELGASYEVLELEGAPGQSLVDDPAAIQDYMLEKTGARSVPRVFINGKFVGGGDDIVAMKASGELADLLRAAGAIAGGKKEEEEEPLVLDTATVAAAERALAATGVKIGDPFPEVTVQRGDEFPPSPFNLAEFASDKKVVLVGLPGAFTPT